MPSKRMLSFLLAAPLWFSLALVPTTASAETHDQGVCLFSADVDHVQPLDDKHILFFMQDGAVWENTLFRECYTLRPDSKVDWGHDYWHLAVCSWPTKPFPLPMKDSRYPPDTRVLHSVFLRPSFRLPCQLGQFTPYTPGTPSPIDERTLLQAYPLRVLVAESS